MFPWKGNNPLLAPAVEFAILEAVLGKLENRRIELDDLLEGLKHRIGQARADSDPEGIKLFSKLADVVRGEDSETCNLIGKIADWQEELLDEIKRLAIDSDDETDKQNKPA